MMKDYAGIYDISTSWKKLKTLPLGTFERYAQPHLPPSNCSEEFKILRDTNIKPNKRKIMVLKSWMCKKQTGILRLLFKELDNRVVKKKQVDQEKDEYMKPYKNAKYIVLNRDDDNQQLCYGIVKVSKITKNKIVGNLIVPKNHRYVRSSTPVGFIARQSNFIDSVTIGEKITLSVGINYKKKGWIIKYHNWNNNITNMTCIEREDMSYYVTREDIKPCGAETRWSPEKFTAVNFKTPYGDWTGKKYLHDDNDLHNIKMYYYVREKRNLLGWVF